MRSCSTRIAVVVTLATFLGGCADKQAGTAMSATTPTGVAGSNTGSGSRADHRLMAPVPPGVDVPLDAIRVLSQPCAALSPTQLKAFNVFKPGTRHLDGASGPGCDWRTDEQPAPPSATCACLPGTSTRPRPSELLRTGVGHAR